eukprot:scaffold135163_cov26-Tisochrysis_lutea.AAC.1
MRGHSRQGKGSCADPMYVQADAQLQRINTGMSKTMTRAAAQIQCMFKRMHGHSRQDTGIRKKMQTRAAVQIQCMYKEMHSNSRRYIGMRGKNADKGC